METAIGTGASVVGRKLDLKWDSREYTEIKFEWKLSANGHQLSRPVMVRLTDRGRNFDYRVGTRDLFPTVTGAGVQSRDGDGYGETMMSGYYTDDTLVRRQMVLMREGVLIVRDSVSSGRAADGMVAGPIWHLAIEPAQQGNWFDTAANGDGDLSHQRLMVSFALGKGRESGMQHVHSGRGLEPYTVFAKQTLKAGEAAVFVSVLTPHPAEIPAGTLAQGLTFDMMKDRTRLKLAFPNCHATVEIGDDGEWSVAR
jgi:hypothetical protein